MTYRLTVALLSFCALPAQAATTFFRAHDADSVILGPICVPAADGVGTYGALDFDTTDLSITIYASGDGVDSSFSYSGGDIDDYDGTPPAWGDPTTNAVELEADDDCIRLHIRDEVLAVAGATEWTVLFQDSTTDNIMDHEVQVLALATSADAQADVTAALEADGLDHLVSAAVSGSDVTDNSIFAKLVSKSATADWDDFVNTTDALQGLYDNVGLAGAGLTNQPWNSGWDSEVQSEVDDGLIGRMNATGWGNAELFFDGSVTLFGTCSAGSTTTCDDAALDQADASQLEGRIACYDDAWCALVTTFDPANDRIAHTKEAPSTRNGKTYIIFPATAQ